MKFKTVSEFIHALEVEGKKFEHPYDRDYFVVWIDGGPGVIAKDTLPSYEASYDFHEWKRVLSHDWQEYQAELETEEIELEEWLVNKWNNTEFAVYWVAAGSRPEIIDAFKTGVTRKVKVPK